LEDSFRKLKPRPGHAGRDIEEHQRARLHAATIELVSKDGFKGLTVTGIARTAGVANRTFYENFQGKEECFLATYDLIAQSTAREILAAQRREQDLPRKLSAGVLTFLHAVAENPKAAHLALIEAPAVESALDRTRHMTGLFEALVTECLTTAPDSIDLPPPITKGIVAGLIHVARSHLSNGAEGDLMVEGAESAGWALSLADEAADQVFAPPQAKTPHAPAAQRARYENSHCPPGDERAMILLAVGRLAASEGYDALTIPRIRSSVGISRRRFEEHFTSVDECFLAVLEMHRSSVFASQCVPDSAASSWQDDVYAAMAMLLERFAADPALARLLFSELHKAGREGARWRTEFIADLSSYLYASAPSEARPSQLVTEASAAAVCALLDSWATRGRQPWRLPLFVGPAAYLILAPAIGADAAVKAVCAQGAASAHM
jgi:AcrR family transcriptional regulator